MIHTAARSAEIPARRNAAIRAAGFDPRRVAIWATIRERREGSDVWQVTRRDRFGTHIVGSVAVSY